MSLRVWLPLNGDLHNQGLSNVTVTNNGATVDNNGKIGKCYYFNGSSAYMSTSYSTAIGTSDFSIAMWIKIPTLTSGTYYAICTSKTTAAVSSGFGIYWNYSQKKFLWSTADGSNATEIWMASAVDNIVYDKWIHLVMIRNNNDPKKGYFYINGIRYELASIPVIRNITTNTQLYLGRCTGGSYLTKMYLNDFRIYDHALSVKEVEEIARGLVLHYKLDQGNPNLLSKYVTPGGATPGSTATGGRTIYNGDYSITIPASENADTYFRLFLTQQLIQGKTYTISCYVSGLLNGSYYRFPLFAQNNTSMGVLQLDHNGLCSLTFTMNSSAQNSVTTPDGSTVYICFMDDSARALASGQGQITLFGFKLEEGNLVTSWAPSNLMNIVYDSSGYDNNGTIIGVLEVSTSSSRYSCATHFTATTSKVLIENLNTLGFANSYSFIWWGKINTFSNKMFWGFADGVRLNGIYNGNLWNTGDGANNPLYIPGTTTQVTAPSLNTWHHFAMVGNGTTCVVYLDGELWGQAKTYKSISGTKIYMNGWDSGTSYTTNDMSISDFRIYATALTPEQVKELYNTTMSIDNNGNIHARELVEV